jgi:hypothetical protein
MLASPFEASAIASKLCCRRQHEASIKTSEQFSYDVHEFDSPEIGREVIVWSVMRTQEAEDPRERYRLQKVFVRDTLTLAEDLVGKRPKVYIVHCG